MSLSGNQFTGIGPVQVKRSYAVFVAKEEATGVGFSQGGSFIFLNATDSAIFINSTASIVRLNGTNKVIML